MKSKQHLIIVTDYAITPELEAKSKAFFDLLIGSRPYPTRGMIMQEISKAFPKWPQSDVFELAKRVDQMITVIELGCNLAKQTPSNN